MKQNKKLKTSKLFLAVSLVSLVAFFWRRQQTTAQNASAKAKAFATRGGGANALIDAAEKFDEAALAEILGPDSYDIIHTGEPARDREVAQKFAGQARVKTNVSFQPRIRVVRFSRSEKTIGRLRCQS